MNKNIKIYKEIKGSIPWLLCLWELFNVNDDLILSLKNQKFIIKET